MKFSQRSPINCSNHDMIGVNETNLINRVVYFYVVCKSARGRWRHPFSVFPFLRGNCDCKWILIVCYTCLISLSLWNFTKSYCTHYTFFRGYRSFAVRHWGNSSFLLLPSFFDAHFFRCDTFSSTSRLHCENHFLLLQVFIVGAKTTHHTAWFFL